MKTLTLSIAIIGLIGLAISQTSFSDSDDEHGQGLWQRDAGVAQNPLYNAECGGCHFAYPPDLLPQRSWQAIMSTLDDHYGDNAELDSTNLQAISRYLIDNSAESSTNRRLHKLQKGLSASHTPLRITELPKFVREHDEIPKKVLINNPKLNSLSQCPACHGDAEQGRFSERRINIPGYGGWDD